MVWAAQEAALGRFDETVAQTAVDRHKRAYKETTVNLENTSKRSKKREAMSTNAMYICVYKLNHVA